VLLVLQPLFGTSPLMAALIEVGFEGGHGTAAGLGTTFRELGLPAGETLGLAMATVGVLTAVLLGSTLVVIGRGRQWLARVDPARPVSGGVDPISAEERLNLERAAGTVDSDTPRSMTIDALTLNVALAGGAVGLGVLLKALLTGFGALLGGPDTASLIQAIPVFPLAMVGGLIVQVVLQRSQQTDLASPVAQASLGSVSMDLLITAAMASLNLPLLEENWIPFVALAVTGLTWNVCAFLLIAPRIFRDHWFERGIADFGQGTGVTATGLLLLRMADPLGRSRAMEAFSFKQLLFEPFLGGGLVTALSLVLIAGWGLPLFSAAALALTLASLGFGLRLGRAR